jgi:hypothetical protein
MRKAIYGAAVVVLMTATSGCFISHTEKVREREVPTASTTTIERHDVIPDSTVVQKQTTVESTY